MLNQAKKSERPHQFVAIHDIVNGVIDNPRCQAHMACGTGKSLISLWVMEQYLATLDTSTPKTVLVLVPSLALISQLAQEWVAQRSTSFDYLCVCSDKSVVKGINDGEELDFSVEDAKALGMNVTTKSEDVLRFLESSLASKNPSNIKVVFSTYQSANVVAVGMPGDAYDQDIPFDLAIFDEAHKTANRKESMFNLALMDKKIPINKRLFMTATPRHHVIRSASSNDHTHNFSMDNQELYGPVVHKLSFKEAAKQGIICNYKIIVSVVTSAMLTNTDLKHGIVDVNGTQVHAKIVAQQIALKQAADIYGVNRIFTFHSTVADAAEFTSTGPAGINTHMPDFEALHVSGSMPTSYRQEQMDKFKSADKAVISNARCLTEGVDVPSVGMVAFMDPRKSLVDIVQAGGRAMRISEGKTVGYIMVPLFLEQALNETTEEALARADYGDIWNILNSMQDQDESMVDIIREMNESRGRTGQFDTSAFFENVDIICGDNIHLNVIKDSITARCVEDLGESWDFRFGQLEYFKLENGHLHVPQKYNKNMALGTWVSAQRTKKDSLTNSQINKLDEIGFIWNTAVSLRLKHVNDLKAFVSEYGHSRVPAIYDKNPALGTWVNTQRTGKQKLTAEQIDELDKLNFVWDFYSESRSLRIKELIEFKSEYGHSMVPATYDKNPALGSWVANQRNRKQNLTEEQINELDKLNFYWDSHAEYRSLRIKELIEFISENGHSAIPVRYSANKKLGAWAANQRYKKDSLTKEQITELDSIGFDWVVNKSPKITLDTKKRKPSM